MCIQKCKLFILVHFKKINYWYCYAWYDKYHARNAKYGCLASNNSSFSFHSTQYITRAIWERLQRILTTPFASCTVAADIPGFSTKSCHLQYLSKSSFVWKLRHVNKDRKNPNFCRQPLSHHSHPLKFLHGTIPCLAHFANDIYKECILLFILCILPAIET